MPIADIADDACADAVVNKEKVRDLESRVAKLEERLGTLCQPPRLSHLTCEDPTDTHYSPLARRVNRE